MRTEKEIRETIEQAKKWIATVRANKGKDENHTPDACERIAVNWESMVITLEWVLKERKGI
jgi:hypothetical protein